MVRHAFRRGSTFALFALLATGLAARTTRRTVVGMLAGAGIPAGVSFHSACRFFSHHAWDVDPIGLVLARLIADRLLPEGAPITGVVDDTLFRSTKNPGDPGYGGWSSRPCRKRSPGGCGWTCRGRSSPAITCRSTTWRRGRSGRSATCPDRRAATPGHRTE